MLKRRDHDNPIIGCGYGGLKDGKECLAAGKICPINGSVDLQWRNYLEIELKGRKP